MTEWNKEIRGAILDSGRTISDVARESGVDRKTLHNIFGGRLPRIETVDKILNALDLKLVVVDKGVKL